MTKANLCKRCGGALVAAIAPGSPESRGFLEEGEFCGRCESKRHDAWNRYDDHRRRLGSLAPEGRALGWTERALLRPSPTNLEAWGRSRGKRAVSRAHASGCELVEFVSLFDLAQRDGWICGICGHDVDPRLASFHHVVPKVAGGEHTVANPRLAHVDCNATRSLGLSREEWDAWKAVLPEEHASGDTMRTWLKQRRAERAVGFGEQDS